MKKCDACGKRAEGLGTYATTFGSIVLCSDCYEGNKALRLARSAKTEEQFQKVWDGACERMKEQGFPEHVQNEIKVWLKENKNLTESSEKLEKFMANCDLFPMTTGFNFEGYEISDYLGIVSGESVLGTGFLSSWNASIADMFGAESDSFIEKLKEAKTMATQRLVRETLKRGGNAVIGVDIDYTMFTSNLIGVIVNGTCVIRKKRES